MLELKKRRDRFVGKIVGVDAIAGIFVEVAPGIQFKGLKSRNLANPTVEDAKTKRLLHVSRLISTPKIEKVQCVS